MEIDPTTLADLEVFRSPDGSEGLLALVDRTCTGVGRRSLRERLKRPMVDVREVRRTQEAVRFLAERPRLFRIDDRSVAGVERYLSSNIETSEAFPLGERIEYLWVAVRYRDIVRELREGVRETATFFERLAGLARTLEDEGPPELIGVLAGQLAGVASEVVRRHGEATTLLGADRALRRDLREGIEEALAALGELDALNAMALSTAELGWTMPELVESESFLLDADDVFHPFVEDPVTNGVHLSGGEPMVFLTGPNMAGKTTYLRSVSLVVFLAQVGMGVPASRARLTPVEALFTSLNPSDDLKAGLSYFLAEVMRVKAAATLLADGRRALVMFDEVFKGTNVKDALEASAEVILGFARARGSGFIFSSHLAELVETLRTNPSIRFWYFDGDIVKGVPHYSYELKSGVSDKHFGLFLLRQARIPELIARISA